MHEIMILFAEKYGLTINEVMAEMEKVFSAILSQWYRVEVMAIFRHDLKLEAVAYNKVGGVVLQKDIDLKKMGGTNSIVRRLENSLSLAAVLKQTRQYKYYEREIRWGNIAIIDREKNYHVEIEIVPGKTITAFCPLNRVGLHDQNSPSFSVGMKRAFHVRRVDPVVLGGIPRLKVMVDRVSKNLVEALLREQLGGARENTTIHCTKRYVGQKSFVVTSRRIPKAAIVAVAEELGEPLQVRFIREQ
ncbi:hypothetical protein JWG42_01190 [Desulfoprunum benzoelyticum]|jgi:hypothetical protein|uniref:Uncharacterized protein n=1 Tax=Desulfoprunum benzoelyticum TaxID=1506996 RepID=A0A840V5N1_9BACT|nr:hypothetical protein [Desulfoprunum benzoelyticum]MBB5348371.1 hypothetical protein [Desulfoprunum benzoelyticum]MBM9528770.1 hypothetical protein [Desulfoprunum benzoelyticum]